MEKSFCDVMQGSRRFLLLLVLACVTCVILVQISMEDKRIGRTLQYTDNLDSKDQMNYHEALIAPEIQANQTSPVVQVSMKSSTAVQKPPSTKPPIIPKPKSKTETIKPKVQVRRVPLSKQVETDKKQQVLVSRHDRLQEILKHKSNVQNRPTLDPMRSLRSMPVVDPNKVIRIFVLTYFRAGSSFFGDILQQNWKTFYHFEPLHTMTYDKRIDDGSTSEAFALFNNIFKCNYTESKEYMHWVRQPRNQFLFAHNLFLWVTCHGNPKLCFNPSFVNAVCVRSPVHVIKATRLHMRQLRTYLTENPDINAKVVYLTRDPRGIVSSRWSLDWCNGTSCSDSGVLCREMDEDFEIFNQLQNEQPLNFVKVRYEDLSLNPELETEKLFSFLNLPYSQSVKKFLKTHTVSRKADDKNPYSTRRNSTSMAFSWKERFTYNQIVDVQSQCSDILHKLNHSFVNSPSELPYPNGRTPKNLVKPSQQTRLWRFNQNPLAKKFLADNPEFFKDVAQSSLPNSSIHSSNIYFNNTNIEVHSSFKVISSSPKDKLQQTNSNALIT